MGILTPMQELLDDYFATLKMPLVRRAHTIAILQESEATMEMVWYIAKTEETDREKLIEAAKKIAQKYKREDEEDWLINDEDDLE